MHLAEYFKGCIQSANTKSHNRNLEGLLYKQLNDPTLCLNFRAIGPMQARVMSCVVLPTQQYQVLP